MRVDPDRKPHQIAKAASETTLDLTGIPLSPVPFIRFPKPAAGRPRQVIDGTVRCQRCGSRVEPKRRCYECMVRQRERMEPADVF